MAIALTIAIMIILWFLSIPFLLKTYRRRIIEDGGFVHYEEKYIVEKID